MRRSVLSIVGVLVLVVAGIAVASSLGAKQRPAVKAVRTAGYGKVLVTSSGLTLYRFTVDRRGASSCSGACAKLWPPLLVKGKQELLAGPGVRAAKLGTIRRAGGARQVTYGGFPLYTFASDMHVGDVTGQGVKGVWFVVSPTGTLIRRSSTAAAPPPPTNTAPPPYSYG